MYNNIISKFSYLLLIALFLFVTLITTAGCEKKSDYTPKIVSGTITPQNRSAIDSDVNDATAPYKSNNTVNDAQAIQSPVIVGGFVSSTATGDLDDRFGETADSVDMYRVTLTVNQSVTLQISDYEPDFPGLVDLNIQLFDTTDTSTAIASSMGNSKTESFTIDTSGEYILTVDAISGYSSYILSLGQQILSTPNTTNQLSLAADFIPDEIIVRYKPNQNQRGALDNSIQSFSASVNLDLVAGGNSSPALLRIPTGNLRQTTIQTFKLAANQATSLPQLLGFTENEKRKYETIQVINQLRSRPEVLTADPNYIRKLLRSPNDTHYSKQWHFPLINLPQAWDITTGFPVSGNVGEEVIVAIVDTGVFLSHTDLSSTLIAGFDFISDDLNSGDNETGIDDNPDDPGDSDPSVSQPSSFHGTHVAGTVAAQSNNSSGVTGVSWDAKIMPIRVLGKKGGSSFDVLQGIQFAAGLDNESKTFPSRKADIINLSLGGDQFSQTELDVFNQVRGQGVIVIAAAGNFPTTNPSYPAAYEGVISVSAVNQTKKIASYSSRGSTIDIAAPGGDSAGGIFSTIADDSSGQRISSYTYYQGTSMAAPHVAGVVALMKAVYPTLSPDDFDLLLRSGAITEDLANNGSGMRDDLFGYGLIDALKAVSAAASLELGALLPGSLSITPSVLNFDGNTSTIDIEATNVGQQAFILNGITSNSPWLTVLPVNINPSDGLGTYRATVDRNNLIDGYYYASLTAATDLVGNLEIPVTMISGELIDQSSNIGQQWILAIETEQFNIVDFTSANINQQGTYNYSFVDLPIGNYFIATTSDSDNDYTFCDAGESCGAYPTFSQPLIVQVSTTSIADINFDAGFNFSFSATTNLLLNGANTLRIPAKAGN